MITSPYCIQWNPSFQMNLRSQRIIRLGWNLMFLSTQFLTYHTTNQIIDYATILFNVGTVYIFSISKYLSNQKYIFSWRSAGNKINAFIKSTIKIICLYNKLFVFHYAELWCRKKLTKTKTIRRVHTRKRITDRLVVTDRYHSLIYRCCNFLDISQKKKRD